VNRGLQLPKVDLTFLAKPLAGNVSDFGNKLLQSIKQPAENKKIYRSIKAKHV